MRHHEQTFQLQAASAELAFLTALTVLTLILPNFAISSPVRDLARRSLFLAPRLPCALRLVHFHTDGATPRLLPVGPGRGRGRARASSVRHDHRAQRGIAPGGTSRLRGTCQDTHARCGGRRFAPWLPMAVVGIVIAALVLLPEGVAALRAAQANRLQTSLNLALGSSLATIGLTIPAVASVAASRTRAGPFLLLLPCNPARIFPFCR